MTELFSLGSLYVSDFLKQGEIPRHGKSDLTLVMDPSSGAVRLKSVTPMEAMYGKYWYRSGINDTMKDELKDIVDSIVSLTDLKENDLWIDIACNDGTLLSFIPDHVLCVGIDPADNTFYNESSQHADLIIQDYFPSNNFSSHPYGEIKAKVITCIAMFYDIDNPDDFLKHIHHHLDDDGLFVLQLSYSPLMLEQNAFDNICHEHIYYYTYQSISNLLHHNGFKVVDCQLNDVNGGSFRLYVQKKSAKPFRSQPYRDVCLMRIASLQVLEKQYGYNLPAVWKAWGRSIEDLRKKIFEFISAEKAKGKTIWAYAGSTKGNTLLQYFNLDHTLIDAIADRSIYKWGLRTVGTKIPIVSEDEMRKAQPDYLLILAWHFIDEFKKREYDYLAKGGKFIVPCPVFSIVDLNGTIEL